MSANPTFQEEIFQSICLLIDNDSYFNESALAEAKTLVTNYDGSDTEYSLVTSPLAEWFSDTFCTVRVNGKTGDSPMARQAKLQVALLRKVLESFDWDDMAEHYMIKAKEALRVEAEERHARLTQF